jgi:hypothetical protein
VEAVVESANRVPIRLSSERWMHIVEHHDDLAGYYHAVLETILNAKKRLGAVS